MCSSVLQPLDRRRALAASCAAGVMVAVILVATSPALPMVWDEGNAILRARQIPAAWPYTTREEGHPALYGLLIAAGSRLAGGRLDPLTAARLGPMVLFAVAAGAAFYRMARHVSPAGALGAVAGLLLIPRLFAHAHFATCDGPLTAGWLLSAMAFQPAWQRRSSEGPETAHLSHSSRHAVPDEQPGQKPRRRLAGRLIAGGVVFGVFLGMTFSSKATGLLAPIAPLVWLILYRDRRGMVVFAVGLAVAAGTFYALNPPLWSQPVSGVAEFLDLNLHRAQRLGLNIPVVFLGRLHHLGNPLPWYNTLFWTAVTVPVGLLGLATLGMIAVWRLRRECPAGVLLWLSWLVLMVVRAIPGTPVHDGVRLFLPSFAFLALLVGLGCHLLLSAVLNMARPASPDPTKCSKGESPPLSTSCVGPWCWRAATGLVLAVFAGSGTSLLWYAPQWLSYYNLLAGWLRGAVRLGMEPTYYWDGLDQQTLDWLNAHTGLEETIVFAPISRENLLLLRRWGRLQRKAMDIRSMAPSLTAEHRVRWYVLQQRPSAFSAADRLLLSTAKPAFAKYIRAGGWGPWRLDVPVVVVFAWEDYQEACAAAAATPP